MKVKKINVQIKSLKEGLEDFRKTAKAIQEGVKVFKKKGVYFTSLKAIRNILTERRMELLEAIKTKQPSNIKHLAKLVDRDFKSVHRDLQYLVDLGLVLFEKGKGRGQVLKPQVLYNTLELRIAV